VRIRTVKPAFWTNEKMAVMPDFTRLLALGLLNYADDHGYFWANCLMIRGALFPFEEDSTRIRRALAQLATEGYLRLGKCPDGREAGQVVNFSKHQRVDRATESEIQPLASFDEPSTNVPRVLDDHSLLDRKGREGKGILAAAPPPRERNPLFDALCLVEGIPLGEVGKAGGRIGKSLSEILAASPDVSPEEIARRGRNYQTHFSGAALTAAALAKHWGKCHARSTTGSNSRPETEVAQY